jgi:hypothetical protein
VTKKYHYKNRMNQVIEPQNHSSSDSKQKLINLEISEETDHNE